jgi:hypothetical protein
VEVVIFFFLLKGSLTLILADTGILTIIPCYKREVGCLQIFNVQKAAWQSVEELGLAEEGREGEGEGGLARFVVIGGDVLDRLSNHFYLPTMHRVLVSICLSAAGGVGAGGMGRGAGDFLVLKLGARGGPESFAQS